MLNFFKCKKAQAAGGKKFKASIGSYTENDFPVTVKFVVMIRRLI
jgi:hypothetical protein